MEDLKPFLSVLLEIACYRFLLDIFLEKQNKKYMNICSGLALPCCSMP